ncbi:GntR family transcriptional regulator [Nocardia sp. NPDC051750]|uniref:GntR family transcriptional regulator n=1 Tax=Nocardia sp. NPDC051750 TaxID=3364325 RepID=UPI0037924FE4
MAELSYQTVARSLRAQIVDGTLAEGAQVPTESVLAERFGVSRQTVRRAFQDLVADNLVVRTRGRGTFVSTPAAGYIRQVGSVDDLMNLSDDTRMRVVQPLSRRIDRSTADRLRLPDDIIWEVSFVRLHENTPFCLTTVALPPRVARLLADVTELQTVGISSDLTIIGLLDEALPRRIGQAQQSITVGKLPSSAAPHLDSEPDQPTLLIDRLYFDTDGVPVEVAVSHFLPHYYSYRVQLSRG